MNERIQQLLIEAHKQSDGGIYKGHLSIWTEKFAELIVRDIHAYVDGMDTAQVISTGILRRYGVE